jgi:hypothetical protein
MSSGWIYGLVRVFTVAVAVIPAAPAAKKFTKFCRKTTLVTLSYCSSSALLEPVRVRVVSRRKGWGVV